MPDHDTDTNEAVVGADALRSCNLDRKRAVRVGGTPAVADRLATLR
ncbi:MAG: hypothetical protein E6640_01780 [Actinomyces urogenitalis]|nr:hypothetical protein [Actinomyces urogenitalis]MDU6150941.1 hypothetical protein [Actinomyces urogenitalis]